MELVNWPHGKKVVVSYDDQGLTLGIRGMWIRAATGVKSNEHVLPLEVRSDDGASQGFMVWAVEGSAAWI